MAHARGTPEMEAVAKVQAELTELQAKSADLADQYLRAKADAENARRRAEEDVSKARRFAVEAFADSLAGTYSGSDRAPIRRSCPASRASY